MKQHLDRGESMTPPYRELQRLWDNALMELETAAEEYSNAVKQFHDEVSVVEERDVS
jgi:hypothetical protein